MSEKIKISREENRGGFLVRHFTTGKRLSVLERNFQESLTFLLSVLQGYFERKNPRKKERKTKDRKNYMNVGDGRVREWKTKQRGTEPCDKEKKMVRKDYDNKEMG